MKYIIFLTVAGIFLLAACTQSTQTQENLPIVQPEIDDSPSIPPEQHDTETQNQPVVEHNDNEQLQQVKEFEIISNQFSFDPETIEVNKGDKVKLTIISNDVPHGFAIKEYGINERVELGKSTIIEFTADKEGTFTSYCSVFCGSGHGQMKGKFIVK